jgi:hypothetical protein
VCIQNDEMYQLDATIVIYYHKYLYMFRAPICPSSGVQVVLLLHMVFNTGCCSSGPEESVRGLVHCVQVCFRLNCCIRLVHLIIFIYDERSHRHQICVFSCHLLDGSAIFSHHQVDFYSTRGKEYRSGGLLFTFTLTVKRRMMARTAETCSR